MRSPIILLLTLFTLSCSSSNAPRLESPASTVAQQKDVNTSVAAEQVAMTARYGSPAQPVVSLSGADNAEATAEAAERKIIRNADITIEVASTADAS